MKASGLLTFPNSFLRRFPWEFAALFLLALLFMLPAFDSHLWYDGDTAHYFEVFYTFYNHVFFNLELPRWLPYGGLGIQADYWQLGALSPSQYLIILAGAILRIQNTAMMFKVSVLMDQALLLWGMHLLGSRIFKSRISTFFASLAILGSGLWLFNLLWNFRIYYLLPLVFYFLIRFAEDEENCFLWLGGMVFLAAQLGVTPYFVCLNTLVVLLLFLLLLGLKPVLFKKILPSRTPEILLALFFLLASAAYLYFAFHMLDHTINNTPNRDPEALSVTLAQFLTHGNWTGPEKFINLLAPGYLNLNVNFYVGAVPLAFALLSLSHPVKSRRLAFLLPLILLILLSLGEKTPAAAALYHLFPPLHYFRGIGLIAGPIRLLLVLMAGYGMDDFLEPRKSFREHFTTRFLLSLLGFAVAAGIFLSLRPAVLAPLSAWILWPSLSLQTGGVLLALAFLPLAMNFRSSWIAMAFVLALGADLTAFQKTFYDSWPLQNTAEDPVIFQTTALNYQASRAYEADLTPRMILTQRMLLKGISRFQKEIHSFLLFDTTNVEKFSNFEWNTYAYRFLRTAKSVCAATGDCRQMKLRLLTDVSFAPDERTADAFVRHLEKKPEKMIIQDAPAAVQKTSSSIPADPPSGEIHVTGFTFNQLEAEVSVTHPGGAWLYYADAWRPGWKAAVDGKSREVFRANLAFKAVLLPAGTHHIRLYYWDGVQSGISILLALGGILFCLLIPFARYPIRLEKQPSDNK